jgi:3-methyladenine DNA glycosylase Tag
LAVTPFATIRARAESRKGGPEALMALLPHDPEPGVLARVGDDRVLAAMAKRIFSAGFVWSVIETKWPGFEEAFVGFDPNRLLFEPDEFWERLVADTRIVRNPQKIMAVRANAQFVLDVSREHGGFGAFLEAWPREDQIGLMALLAARGSRLGGATAQYFLRFIGFDSFITSLDVIACLRDADLDIAQTPTSKKDLAKIQAQFNTWRAESGLSATQIARICAMSIGENYSTEILRERAGRDD